MSLIPPLGSQGVYRLSAPFDTQIVPSVSYTCMANRRLADIIALGIDPFDVFYSRYGITYETYQAALAKNEVIVSLQSSGGQWVYVPSDYILSYPNVGGVPYTAVIMGIELGAVPNYLNLTPLKLKIRDIVREYIGVTSEVKSVVVSEVKNLNEAEHTILESARAAAVSLTETDYTKYVREKTRADALQLRLNELQNWIEQNHLQ